MPATYTAQTNVPLSHPTPPHCSTPSYSGWQTTSTSTVGLDATATSAERHVSFWVRYVNNGELEGKFWWVRQGVGKEAVWRNSSCVLEWQPLPVYALNGEPQDNRSRR